MEVVDCGAFGCEAAADDAVAALRAQSRSAETSFDPHSFDGLAAARKCRAPWAVLRAVDATVTAVRGGGSCDAVRVGVVPRCPRCDATAPPVWSALCESAVLAGVQACSCGASSDAFNLACELWTVRTHVVLSLSGGAAAPRPAVAFGAKNARELALGASVRVLLYVPGCDDSLLAVHSAAPRARAVVPWSPVGDGCADLLPQIVEEFAPAIVGQGAAKALLALWALHACGPRGAAHRLHAAIVGAPRSGKSSLLLAIYGKVAAALPGAAALLGSSAVSRGRREALSDALPHSLPAAPGGRPSVVAGPAVGSRVLVVDDFGPSSAFAPLVSELASAVSATALRGMAYCSDVARCSASVLASASCEPPSTLAAVLPAFDVVCVVDRSLEQRDNERISDSVLRSCSSARRGSSAGSIVAFQSQRRGDSAASSQHVCAFGPADTAAPSVATTSPLVATALARLGRADHDLTPEAQQILDTAASQCELGSSAANRVALEALTRVRIAIGALTAERDAHARAAEEVAGLFAAQQRQLQFIAGAAPSKRARECDGPHRNAPRVENGKKAVARRFIAELLRMQGEPPFAVQRAVPESAARELFGELCAAREGCALQFDEMLQKLQHEGVLLRVAGGFRTVLC